jgi:hypothetical protein
VSWPFLTILDADRKPTGWALVNGPIVTFAQQEELARHRRDGYRFTGMSSYLTFPALGGNDTLDYEKLCDTWCHCFRKSDRFLTSSIPRALISLSDFIDHYHLSPSAVPQVGPGDAFDFVYVGAEDAWKRSVKNWSLAARCIPRICRELGLRALVVGSPTDDFPPAAFVTFSGPIAWESLLARIARARFLFVPNVDDPSPRVLAEALCLDVPAVVNVAILGGWKYVNRFTGTFFEDESDVVTAVRVCLRQAVAPRAWFCANHGQYLAGYRLLRLLRSVDAAITERSHVYLDDEGAEPAPGRSD